MKPSEALAGDRCGEVWRVIGARRDCTHRSTSIVVASYFAAFSLASVSAFLHHRYDGAIFIGAFWLGAPAPSCGGGAAEQVCG
jgi:hypothetical protein